MASPDPIAHIGYHKTGTGWFQRRFYPAVGNARYVPRATVREALLGPSALQFDPIAARQHLEVDREGEGESVLLCEEELSGNIHWSGLRGCLTKDVAYRLRQVLSEARIVIFIRNQYSALASSYVEYIKEGGTHPPRHYFFPDRRYRRAHYALRSAPHFSFDHFDYHTLARHYEEVFGRDRVHVFLFEEFQQGGKRFVQGFAEELGLEVDPEAVAEDRVNPGYPAVLLPLARGLNRFTWRDVPDKHYFFTLPGCHRFRVLLLRGLSRLISPMDPAPFRLDAKTKAAAARHFSEGNRRLAEDRGLDLARHGYPMRED